MKRSSKGVLDYAAPAQHDDATAQPEARPTPVTRGAIVAAVIGGYVALMIAAVAATERSMEILIMAVPVIVPTFTPLVVSLVLHFSRRRVHDHADEKQSQGNALTLKHNETGLIP